MSKQIFKEMALNGRWRPSEDPATLPQDFQTYTNLRPKDNNPEAVGGMTKINTTALTTYLKVRSAHHFTKTVPNETHVLVQAYNTGKTASQILENYTAIPSQGDFDPTVLWTDSASAGKGRFSDAPQGHVAYCNGVDSTIWAGNEGEIDRFINYDSGGTWEYDFTDILRNTLTDSLNLALLHKTAANNLYLYVGSTKMLDYIMPYVSVANDTAGVTAVNYWNGSWTAATDIVDGTDVSGTPFAQTGTITWETGDAEKPHAINGVVLYWYQIVVTGFGAVCKLSHCSCGKWTFQTIRDTWDGNLRNCLSFLVYKSSTYNDYTVNVTDDSYDSANTATFVEIDALATATDYIVMGFTDRLTGISIHLIGGHVNTTAATGLTVSYSSDGVGWTSVGTLDDGTKTGAISFAKSGVITWTPPDSNAEFEKTISKEIPLYYYKFVFDKNLSADVQLFYVGGITAVKELHGYSFPVYARNRLWLCDNVDEARNTAICCASDDVSVWNGEDTDEVEFGGGDALTAGCNLYSRFGASIYSITLFFKAFEIWGLIGDEIDDFVKFPISTTIGCPAPLTLQTTIISTEGVNKPIALWMDANGVYMFDNNSPIPVHNDIRTYFDKNSSSCINSAMITESVGFLDEANRHYHLLIATGSSTTLDTELVLDLKRLKWFKVDRGSGKYLQFGFQVHDTYGNSYNYGFIDTGYMERLEYGTTFDGGDITSTLQTGDIAPFNGSIMYESQLTKAKLITAAKTTTANTVAITHYGDGCTTGTSLTAVDPTKSGYRIVESLEQTNLGNHTFHSIKLSMTTDDETVGFEPLYLGMEFNILGKILSE